jgi:hypothetical protein
MKTNKWVKLLGNLLWIVVAIAGLILFFVPTSTTTEELNHTIFYRKYIVVEREKRASMDCSDERVSYISRKGNCEGVVTISKTFLQNDEYSGIPEYEVFDNNNGKVVDQFCTKVLRTVWSKTSTYAWFIQNSPKEFVQDTEEKVQCLK